MSKISKSFFKTLSFLSLVNDDNKLSLTNLTLIASVVVMLITKDMTAMLPVALAFINYGHKRHLRVRNDYEDKLKKVKDDNQKEIDAMNKKHKDLELKVEKHGNTLTHHSDQLRN